MNVAYNVLKEAVTSINNATVDTGLMEAIKRQANQRKVLPAFKDIPFVRSPVLGLLEDSYSTDTAGISHVLYAEPSTGKTSACRIFVEKLAVQYDAPALMISGQAPNRDYFSHIATQLGVRKEGFSWIASLIAALQPGVNSDRAHATLILDEFNYKGPCDLNLEIAEAFFRQVYNNSCGFTLIFVTQNKEVAEKLCAMNRWQKIGPLPGITTPDRWSVKEEEGPPQDEDIVWKNLDWTTERLSVMILRKFPGKFDSELGKNGELSWLAGIGRPTRAIEKATDRLGKRRGKKKTVNLP